MNNKQEALKIAQELRDWALIVGAMVGHHRVEVFFRAANVLSAQAKQVPFAYFQKHPISGVWEEVLASSASDDGVVAAYKAPQIQTAVDMKAVSFIQLESLEERKIMEIYVPDYEWNAQYESPEECLALGREKGDLKEGDEFSLVRLTVGANTTYRVIDGKAVPIIITFPVAILPDAPLPPKEARC